MKYFLRLSIILLTLLSLTACGTLNTTIKLNPESNAPKVSASTNKYEVKNKPCQLGVDDLTDQESLMNFTEIARNSNSILYADKKYGHFALQDINTEKIWYSTPNNAELDEITSGTERMDIRSQLIIRYVFKSEEKTTTNYKTENSQVGCVLADLIKTQSITNGIKVIYKFEDSDITIPVKYYLTDDSFCAEIVANEIKEGKKAYLIGINLLPTFGAGDWQEKGQLFIPDGCGALADFNQNIVMNSMVDIDVYGNEKAIKQEAQKLDTYSVNMPVFGTIKGNDTLMGNIVSGDTSASITAIFGNEMFAYNAVSSVFNYRTMDSKEMFSKQGGISNTLNKVSEIHSGVDSYTVKYNMLSGKESGYVGMAKAYRDYLEENGKLKKSNLEPSLNLEIYGAAKLSTSFLGVSYDRIKALTTVSQAKSIVSDLKKSGISDISVRYMGYSGDGLLNGKINTSLSPIKKLGTKKNFVELQEIAELYPDFDLNQVTKGGNGVSLSDGIIRNIFDYKAEQFSYLKSVYSKRLDASVYLLNEKSLLGAARKLMKNYTKSGFHNISFSYIGNNLYSDYSQTDGMYRDQSAQYYQKALSEVSEKTNAVAVEAANAYLLPYVKKIWQAPTYSSAYDNYTTDVPFYQIVLHGYVSLTSPCIIQSKESAVELLKAIETGSEFLFGCTYQNEPELIGTRFEKYYSTGYNNWKDYAIKEYTGYQLLLKKISNKKIMNHREISSGVFETEYENGIKVVVNYTKKDCKYQNKVIKAMNYCMVEGD